jgi:hypothetical protein
MPTTTTRRELGQRIADFRQGLCYHKRMIRIYLSPSGEVRLPGAGENSHFRIAKMALGPAWSGDAEDAYAEMWNRGWVRVVDYCDKVYAERHVKGHPVELKDLTVIQRAWLENQVMSGKQFFWNDTLFSLTTENRLGQASEIVRRLTA